jgi:dethiobiotin synthetase
VDLLAVWRAYETLRQRHPVMIVEGIGGIMVPIAEGFFVADLARMIGLPLIIVARAGLGTINHALLTLEHARAKGLGVAGIILNGARGGEDDPSEKSNGEEIARVSGARILGTVKWRPALRLSDDAQSELADIAENQIAVSALLAGSADC